MADRIASIETFQRDNNLAIVRVRTTGGLEGIGQTSPFFAQHSVPLLHDLVGPFFIGKDPWNHEAVIDEFIQASYKYYGSFVYRALSGIDTALWDLLGKAAGQPVFKLLGGAVRNPVPVYASSMSRSITPEAEGDRLAKLVDEYGFRCVKIRVGQVMGRDVDAAPHRTENVIRRVREALGPDIGIHADANGGFTVARAIEVGRQLEELDYRHFEEPCPFPQIENTAEVAAALDIAVAGGEQDNSLEQFNRMIRTRAVDIIQPDIGYVGGLTRARKVAVMAEAAGIPCTPHCSNRSMLQVFTLHLAAAMPSITQYQEWGIEDTPWTDGVYGPMPEVVDGGVMLSDAPGWGVEIDPDFLATAERRLTR